MARAVKMTAMPQLVSLFNAVGGGAAALVAIDDYFRVVGTPEIDISTSIFVVLGAVIGCVTFSGSIVASGKLQGLISGQPIIRPWTRPVDRGAGRDRRRAARSSWCCGAGRVSFGARRRHLERRPDRRSSSRP